jgi:hypothetical protein
MPLRRGRIWLADGQIGSQRRASNKLRLCHRFSRASARFDEPNLVSAGGLVPVLALADRVGLRGLVGEQLTVPTDRGAHAESKVAALVAGMVAGADSIEDMSLLRHGGMGRLFTGAYAPSTLWSFLRALTCGTQMVIA